MQLERIRNFSTTMPPHFSPAGNVDVLDIVVHQNIRVPDVTVCDILDSDRLENRDYSRGDPLR
jgi:hypothetical protein